MSPIIELLLNDDVCPFPGVETFRFDQMAFLRGRLALASLLLSENDQPCQNLLSDGDCMSRLQTLRLL